MRENIMKRNSKGNYINIIIIFLLLITVISISFTVLAENDNGNGDSNRNGNPGYKVSPPVIVIKVTPAVKTDKIVQTTELYEDLEDIKDEYLQKNMTVEWKENNGSNNITSSADQSNLEFKIEGPLVLNSEKEKKRFGIKSNKKESSHIIDPKYILVKRENDNRYSPLDNWIKVLDRNSNSDKLEFKLDKSLFKDENWRNIEAGVYKSRIKPNLELPGNSGKGVNIVVIVEPVVKIEVPDKLKLKVKEPVNSESESLDWVVNSNKSDITVTFESAGIRLSDEDAEDIEKEIDYKAFFRYLVGNNEDKEIAYESFAPKSSSEVDFTEGKFKLRYSPDEYGDEEWFELLAGNYKDTVTITVREN